MSTRPEPPRSLAILTIDGGGLQAITTLLILDDLLSTIATKNHVPKPRPCDVFDTIAGIGTGGWLAILLGRFHMDVTACLFEWYNIMSGIAPRSMAEEMRMRVLHHCYFDPDRLMQQIHRLTKLYGTGDNLIGDASDGVRTRHVFVAGLKSDGSDYNLFRSYEISPWAAMPNELLEGPKNPHNFKISQAFGVTGATKYFSPPWKELMDKSGKMRFSDIIFPKPHNITELALNEMWGLYGFKVPISVVVNVGPGLVDPHDGRHIARRFLWGLNPPEGRVLRPEPTEPSAPFVEPPELSSPTGKPSESSAPTVEPLEPSAPTAERSQPSAPAMKRSKQLAPDEHLTKDASRSSRMVRILRSGRKKVLFESSRHGCEKPLPRSTVRSVKEQNIENDQHRDERRIEEKIHQRLDFIYGKGSGTALYFRLAPNRSPQGVARNDTEAPHICYNAANDYLNSPEIELLVKELAQRILEV